MDAKDGVKTTRVLHPRTIIPIHYEGWKHFREGRTVSEKEFTTSGLRYKLHWLTIGKTTEVEI